MTFQRHSQEWGLSGTMTILDHLWFSAPRFLPLALRNERYSLETYIIDKEELGQLKTEGLGASWHGTKEHARPMPWCTWAIHTRAKRQSGAHAPTGMHFIRGNLKCEGHIHFFVAPQECLACGKMNLTDDCAHSLFEFCYGIKMRID